MAGKIHKDYERYTYQGGIGGQPVLPGSRRAMAYTEGYVARRNGATQVSNPHPAPAGGDPNNSQSYTCWDQGWRDGNSLYPSTHVGGPTPV